MNESVKIVPFIPLEQVVLFPRALLSIRIPEIGRALGLGDYISQDAELGLALFRKRQESDPGHALTRGEVFSRACIGRIINKEVNEKTTYRILVEGIERVRILEFVRQRPVLMARVEVLHDFIDLTRKAEINAELQHLLGLTGDLSEIRPHFKPILKSITAAYPHPAIIADLITFTFIKDPYAKISILEEIDTLRRLRLVRVQVQSMLLRYRKQRNRDTLK